MAADVELDRPLLSAKASTLNMPDMTLDIRAGIAAIRAQHDRGPATRRAPARASPARLPPLDPLPGHDQLPSRD